MSQRPLQSGFTIIELIMVIVVLGVISAVLSVFMKSPIDAYFATARRSGLADTADTVVRRMSRDIRRALPNSLRPVSANSQCIEFIPTRMGARYRAQDTSFGANDSLAIGTPDTTFNMLGVNANLLPDQKIKVGDTIAVYNLGIPTDDTYANNNTATVTNVAASPTSANETKIDIVSATFPLASAGYRFHVIPQEETIVSYICSGGTLYRNTNYAYTSSCPAPTAGTTPVIATGVSQCQFAYSNADQRNAVVQISLTFQDTSVAVNPEYATIYHEVHVDNTP